MARSITIRIPARFNGPDGHANGGYLCGLLAENTPWLAEFTLRKMIPVEQDLIWTFDDETASLTGNDVTYITARKGSLSDIIAPKNPGLVAAKAADAKARVTRSTENYPNCYVCGPSRADGDGMRLHAGPIDDSEEATYATYWRPAAYMSDDATGLVPNRFIYAALDCPGADAAKTDDEELVLLGRFTVETFHNVFVHDDCVVIGWCSKREGRKRFSHTTVFGPDGQLVARADAIWFVVHDQ